MFINIMLGDIRQFYWCISTSFRVCSLQRFWFRPKGLGTTEDNDMVEYATMCALFGIKRVGSSRDAENRRMWSREAPEGCKI